MLYAIWWKTIPKPLHTAAAAVGCHRACAAQQPQLHSSHSCTAATAQPIYSASRLAEAFVCSAFLPPPPLTKTGMPAIDKNRSLAIMGLLEGVKFLDVARNEISTGVRLIRFYNKQCWGSIINMRYMIGGSNWAAQLSDFRFVCIFQIFFSPKGWQDNSPKL